MYFRVKNENNNNKQTEVKWYIWISSVQKERMLKPGQFLQVFFTLLMLSCCFHSWGETLRQYEMSFLPPLLLTFELPEDYPSSSPPSFSLTCTWLTHAQVIIRHNVGQLKRYRLYWRPAAVCHKQREREMRANKDWLIRSGYLCSPPAALFAGRSAHWSLPGHRRRCGALHLGTVS